MHLFPGDRICEARNSFDFLKKPKLFLSFGIMHRIDFDSQRELDLEALLESIEGENFILEKVTCSPEEDAWCIYREGKSSTPYVFVHFKDAAQYSLFMESLASYQDYSYFSDFSEMIAEALGMDLRNEGIDIDALRSEDWVAESIGEEVAYLKAVLSAGYPYMFSYGKDEDYFIDEGTLAQFGVSIMSSTPRIYGYVQYALKHNLLKTCQNMSDTYPDIEVEVPEHKPVASVKSWQLDGCETWETFCMEDVNLLLEIGQRYKNGEIIPEGVVLNDLGTLYQEGVVVRKDNRTAVFWFEKAIELGDTLYAPGNLGDIYRKGGSGVVRDLSKAKDAYLKSTDPYAHYRIGEAYEEGWTGRPDMVKAFEWYIKAAQEGHHLAIRRIQGQRNRILS